MNKYTYNTLVVVATVVITLGLTYFNEPWGFGYYLLSNPTHK